MRYHLYLIYIILIVLAVFTALLYMKGDFVNETLYSEASATDEFLEDTEEKFQDIYTDIISENESKITVLPRYKDAKKGTIVYFRLVDSLTRKVVSNIKSTNEEEIVELIPKIVIGRKFDLQYKSSVGEEILISRINHEYKL